MNTYVLVKDDVIYDVKGFKKSLYNISDIAGIKFVTSYDLNAWGFSSICTDSKGNTLYYVFYLRDVNNDIRNFDGKGELSPTFLKEYHKNILFSSVYDERVIQYLKTVNPDIEIMD